jgi:hypothetical protein
MDAHTRIFQQIPAVTPDDAGGHRDKGAMLLLDDFQRGRAVPVDLTLLGCQKECRDLFEVAAFYPGQLLYCS